MQETELETINNVKGGQLERIKDWGYENWQTILVILIVLIVGVSAYNYNRQGNENQESSAIVTENNSISEKNELENNIQENSETTAEEDEIESQDQEKAAIEDKQEPEETSSDATNKEASENTNEETVSLKNTDSGKVYEITAKQGEGITHLARHALDEYIQENGGNENLTKEHRIYIEDYMQNKVGNQKIGLGHKETFSENLIKEAISSSQKLSSKSIENLKKYTKEY